MTIDLEDRLVKYRHALDGAISADLVGGDRPARERSRVPLVAAAAVAVLSVGGLVAVSRGGGSPSGADSTVPVAAASPTDGLLPRLLLDPADGWEPVRVEDYVLRDSDGAFTRVDYVNGEQAVSITLRRTREPIVLGEGSAPYGPCGAVPIANLVENQPVGYGWDFGGDGGAFYWPFNDNVLLTVVVEGLAFELAEELARDVTGSDDEGWNAMRSSIEAVDLIADPADERSTWQQSWRGEMGFLPNDQGPGPFDVDTDDLSAGHWERSWVFCTDPA